MARGQDQGQVAKKHRHALHRKNESRQQKRGQEARQVRELHGQLLLARQHGNQEPLGQRATEEQDAGGDEKKQEKLAKQIVSEGLSVRSVEKLSNPGVKEKSPVERAEEPVRYVQMAEEWQNRLGLGVAVKQSKAPAMFARIASRGDSPKHSTSKRS